MTDANSPTVRLDRLEERVTDMTTAVAEMQTEVDRVIDALRNRVRNRDGA